MTASRPSHSTPRPRFPYTLKATPPPQSHVATELARRSSSPAPRVLLFAALLAVALAPLAGCNMPIEPMRVHWPWEPAEPAVTADQARIDAHTYLLQASDDDQPVIRANAVEALGQTAGAEAGTTYLEALTDPSPVVRLTAAMVVGDLRYRPALPRLRAMAGDKTVEPDRRVYCAVIYALHQLGDDRYTTELGRLLFDKEEEVREYAAMAMGKMGQPSAMGPLKTLLTDELKLGVRWQVRESLAMLGDTPSVLSLEGYARQPALPLRLAAISALGRIPSESAPAVLRGLLDSHHDPRVRAAAAGALGRLGRRDPTGYDISVRALEHPTEMLAAHPDIGSEVKGEQVNALRQIAASALGYQGRSDAIGPLHNTLRTAEAGARVAAAMSILRLVKAPARRRPSLRTPASGRSAAGAAPAGPGTLPPPPPVHVAPAKD